MVSVAVVSSTIGSVRTDSSTVRSHSIGSSTVCASSDCSVRSVGSPQVVVSSIIVSARSGAYTSTMGTSTSGSGNSVGCGGGIEMCTPNGNDFRSVSEEPGQVGLEGRGMRRQQQQGHSKSVCYSSVWASVSVGSVVDSGVGLSQTRCSCHQDNLKQTSNLQ